MRTLQKRSVATGAAYVKRYRGDRNPNDGGSAVANNIIIIYQLKPIIWASLIYDTSSKAAPSKTGNIPTTCHAYAQSISL